MATGGIFMLISNDGKQDRMLLATQLLNIRLIQIRRARAKAGYRDPTPTLVDIEKTHILFINAHFKPFAALAYEYNRVTSSSGMATFGGSARFSIPQFGDFFNDIVLHISFSASSATDPLDKIKYVDFPGHRLLQKVSFTVNGNPLDTYDAETMNAHYKFFVPPNKRVGWKRNVGQEIPNEGHLIIEDLDIRERKEYSDGPQTPKTNQGPVDMWIPLIFWFNVDPRLSIPSVSIPYGQRFLDFDFAPLNQMICVTDNGGGGLYTPPEITTCELYINNLFVNPEVHDIFIKRISFTLIRVHLHQTARLNKAADEILLNRLKWPVETMYLCFQPTENETSCENWHRCHQVIDKNVCVPVAITPPDPPGPPAKQLVIRPAVYKECHPIIDSLTIQAHGIPLYNDISAQFFNSYIPYTYGGIHVNTPDDCGALMITFNLFPGSYQPSGHINVSRAREFYLKYNSPFISDENTAHMHIVAIAINFLLVSDGSAVLRYST